MSTADKVVVEFEAKINLFVANIARVNTTLKKSNVDLQKISKETQAFIEKSQKGQALAMEKTARAVQRMQLQTSRNVRKGAEAQVKATEDASQRVVAALNAQMRARDENAANAQKSAKRISELKGLISGVIEGGSFAAKFAKETLEIAETIENQSKVSGISAERFQEMAFAADNVGVSQEKLSGILKDVNDKFGEFNATGSGPLLEFMEKVLPMVGLTEDAFKGLSSDKALGLFVKTLEDAGANDADFTHFLENLATDSTALLPLLKDNGLAMAQLSKEAQDMGLVLSNDAVDASASANRALNDLGKALAGTFRTLATEASPEIEAFASKLVEVTPEIQRWFRSLIEWSKHAATELGEAFRRLQRLGGAAAAARSGNLDLAKSILDNAKTLRQLEEDAAKASNALAKLSRKRLELTRDLRDGDKGVFGLSDVLDKRGLEKVDKKIEEAYDKLDEIEKRIEIAKEKDKDDKKLSDLVIDSNLDSDVTKEKPKNREKPIDRERSNLGLQFEKKKTPSPNTEDLRLERELAVIALLGRSEREQIDDLLQMRLASIEKSNRSVVEKTELRLKAEADAELALGKIVEREAQKKAEHAESDRRAKANELDFIAEIEAATARMNGRAIKATEIEMAARRRRYAEELTYIEDLIKKQGETPELIARRTEVQANVARADEDETNFKDTTLAQIDDVSETTLLEKGDQDSESGLSAQLDQLQAERDAKLELLETFKSEDVELERARQEEILEVMSEYEDKKNQLILDSHLRRFDQAAKFASQLTSVIKAAGLEGTKAAKIAAKAEQGIALGKAVVNGALAVSEAAASAPFPLNIPAIAFAVATNGAQIATIASQTFRDGGVNILGPGTGTSDSIPARISRGESVITAAATRGNEAGLLGLNNGLSPAQAFGLPAIKVPMPNLSVPSISSSSGNRNFRSGDVIIQGNVDRETMPNFLAALADRDRKFSSNVNRIIDARERRTISRRERVLGR